LRRRCAPVVLSSLTAIGDNGQELHMDPMHTPDSSTGHNADRAPASGAAAGWYPIPDRPGAQRYWDGTAWTDHVVDAAAAATPAPPVDRSRRRAVMVLIGGALMAVGAVLPWETASISGHTIKSEAGTSVGSGSIVLVAGGIIALLAFLFLNGTLTRKIATATLVLSGLGLVLTWANFSSISDDIDRAKESSANSIAGVEGSLGIGILMALVGCGMALVVSILLMRQKQVASA
jgi:hypothetical protein